MPGVNGTASSCTSFSQSESTIHNREMEAENKEQQTEKIQEAASSSKEGKFEEEEENYDENKEEHEQEEQPHFIEEEDHNIEEYEQEDHNVEEYDDNSEDEQEQVVEQEVPSFIRREDLKNSLGQLRPRGAPILEPASVTVMETSSDEDDIDHQDEAMIMGENMSDISEIKAQDDDDDDDQGRKMTSKFEKIRTNDEGESSIRRERRKPLFMRISDMKKQYKKKVEDDEIVILEGILDYYLKKGKYPFDETIDSRSKENKTSDLQTKENKTTDDSSSEENKASDSRSKENKTTDSKCKIYKPSDLQDFIDNTLEADGLLVEALMERI